MILVKDENDTLFTEICKFAKEYKQKDARTTVYICQNNICSEPITDLDLVWTQSLINFQTLFPILTKSWPRRRLIINKNNNNWISTCGGLAVLNEERIINTTEQDKKGELSC